MEFLKKPGVKPLQRLASLSIKGANQHPLKTLKLQGNIVPISQFPGMSLPTKTSTLYGISTIT